MRKDIGHIPGLYPMPVTVVAAYDEEGRVNAMVAAWVQICDYDKIILFLEEDHKTTKNIRASKAFTVSLADRDHVEVSDYYGIVTGNEVPDKFAFSGFHSVRSAYVNAPVIEEYPVCIECELFEIIENDYMYGVVGKILNVSVKEEVLDEKGKADITKADILIFDQFKAGYYVTGEKAGGAWVSGKELAGKAKERVQ